LRRGAGQVARARHRNERLQGMQGWSAHGDLSC
jgi:hypothetical protein